MIPVVSIIHNKTPIDKTTFRFLLQFSPPEKQQRILRQRVKQNADTMVIGGALARYMLWKDFRILWDAHIACGELGKPYLSDYPDVHFNISHSGQYVACAVHDSPVGVDIQMIARYRPDIAKRVCTPAEIIQIETHDNPNTEFTKIWTQKEAYLKMLGCGLSKNMDTVLTARLSKLQTLEFKDFIVSCIVQ